MHPTGQRGVKKEEKKKWADSDDDANYDIDFEEMATSLEGNILHQEPARSWREPWIQLLHGHYRGEKALT